MNRFFLTRDAMDDLSEIRRYLNTVPEQYAAPIRRGLRDVLRDIASNPQRGPSHSDATRELGEEIRTRLLPPYRLFYRDHNGTPEILAILHTARDVDSIIPKRLQ